ncbi:DUF6083 domain-containing protein [Streptomyces sp. NPDC001658]
MSERFHWDGSHKGYGKQHGFTGARTMWLHRNNASTTLRRDALTRCRYCGLLMEYFDRYDHLRIPMVPKQIPSAAVPARMRWHIMGGIAFPGDNRQTMCHVPHPAFCPMVEHEDDDLSLAEARAVFRKKSEELIAAGFIPDMRPPRCEEEVAEQHVEDVEGIRHVVAYSGLLWLAPGPVDTIQCVAHANSTDERCKKLVWEGEGTWQEVEIPYAPGRAGQQVLWAGTTMWVYGLHALYTAEFNRWMRQRCGSHAPGQSYAPDAVPPQWVTFDALRHDEYILRQHPAGAEVMPKSPVMLPGIALGPKRTACASTSCRNGSAAPVPEGWLCSQCEDRSARRERTHQKWVTPPSGRHA